MYKYILACQFQLIKLDNISVNCMKLSNNPTALNSKGTNSQLDPFTYMSITKPNNTNVCLVLCHCLQTVIVAPSFEVGMISRDSLRKL